MLLHGRPLKCDTAVGAWVGGWVHGVSSDPIRRCFLCCLWLVFLGWVGGWVGMGGHKVALAHFTTSIWVLGHWPTSLGTCFLCSWEICKLTMCSFIEVRWLRRTRMLCGLWCLVSRTLFAKCVNRMSRGHQMWRLLIATMIWFIIIYIERENNFIVTFIVARRDTWDHGFRFS